MPDSLHQSRPPIHHPDSITLQQQVNQGGNIGNRHLMVTIDIGTIGVYAVIAAQQIIDQQSHIVNGCATVMIHVTCMPVIFTLMQSHKHALAPSTLCSVNLEGLDPIIEDSALGETINGIVFIGNTCNQTAVCITLLINAFFALAVSAARGIAIQVESNVTNFARQIVIAFNPQITKSFAAGDKEYTVKLVRSGAKFGYFLFLFFALPLIIETPTILRLWLGEYPEWSVTFVRLSLISSLILSLTYTLDTTVLASGKIKWFQILSALMLMITFPLTYLLYRLGFPAYCCYLSAIAMTTLMLIIKTVIASRTLDGYHLDFFRVIYAKCIPVTLLTFVPMVMLKRWILPGSDYGIMFINVFICLIWSALIVMWLGLNQGERDILLKKLHLKH